MASQRKAQDVEGQIRDIKKQLSDQLGSLEFRTESKITLLNELQEFFKKRGEVEIEYMRGLDRLAEKSEKATRQRNSKAELHSTHLLWGNLLGETRKTARERGALAEFYNTEMQAMLDVMLKDLHLVTKKCKEFCIDVQDKYVKELKELSESMKAYQYSSHNTQEAFNKLCRSKEKLDAAKQSARGSSRRKDHLESKELERQQQFKENQQRMIKFRNDYLLSLRSCNALSAQYFNKDILGLIEQVDYDYHGGLHRVAESYRESEHTSCRMVMNSSDTVFEQANQLSFDGDLQLFLKENSANFTQPPTFTFIPYNEDTEQEYQLTESVYKDAEEAMQGFETQAKDMEVRIEEETKTLLHMTKNVLEKYKIVPCREQPSAGLDEPAEGAPTSSQHLSTSLTGEDARKALSLERSSVLAPQNVRLQAFHNAQRGKKEDIEFTLNVFQRRLQSSSQLSRSQAKYTLLKRAFEKAPPAAFASNIGPAYHLRELPKLFGGDLVKYINATGVKIPLIVSSCCGAIEARGMDMEGLFRVPGPAQHIEDLRKDFEEGENPFTTPSKEKYKSDIAAIASTLKAYFRELQPPIFPMDKYAEFTACARRDGEERCKAIKATISTLHPLVVDVMAYLFNFLFKVSQHSHENKMSSSNLALVFGPTLVQAPPELDAIQLHNDVPAVNMLIQICIEQHHVIFVKIESPPPPPVELENEPRIVVTPPPAVIGHETNLDTADYADDQQPVQPAVEIRKTPSPKLTDQDIQNALENQPEGSPTTAPTSTQQQQEQQQRTPSPEVAAQQQQQQQEETSPLTKEQEPSAATAGSDETAPPEEEKMTENGTKGDEDDDEEDSDSDEDDVDVTTMTVKATYNYTARNQKELTFSAGDILQVTEKTSDGNWWDGFHDGVRGYIPVAYVEIMEVRTAVKSPLPPARRSSTQVGVDEIDTGISKPAELQRQQSAPVTSPSTSDKEASPQPTSEQVEPAKELTSVVSPTHQPAWPQTVSTIQEENLTQNRSSTPESSTFKTAGQSSTLPPKPKEVITPTAPPKMPSTGNVKDKMAQFLSSSQPSGRPPSPGHRRMKSEGSNLDPGSKVKELKEAYNPGSRDVQPPPATRPKPRPTPSADITRNKEVLEQNINFPIVPHSSGVGASPLQKMHYDVQTQQKPAVLTKPKGSFRSKPKKPTKPAPSAPLTQSTAAVPPRGGFVPPPSAHDPTALHEELRAAAKARKGDKDSTV